MCEQRVFQRHTGLLLRAQGPTCPHQPYIGLSLSPTPTYSHTKWMTLALGVGGTPPPLIFPYSNETTNLLTPKFVSLKAWKLNDKIQIKESRLDRSG